jgi:hypothetical protein
MLPISDSEVSAIVDGPAVAEIWCGSTLLGVVCRQRGGTVLRLESHARGPLTVSAEALERALAKARESLSVAHARPY